MLLIQLAYIIQVQKSRNVLGSEQEPTFLGVSKLATKGFNSWLLRARINCLVCLMPQPKFVSWFWQIRSLFTPPFKKTLSKRHPGRKILSTYMHPSMQIKSFVRGTFQIPSSVLLVEGVDLLHDTVIVTHYVYTTYSPLTVRNETSKCRFSCQMKHCISFRHRFDTVSSLDIPTKPKK